MWPKALAQLIELAPHITRLLPMADRFFQSKSAESEASRTAMEQMAQGLRGDLGQVTASHAGLYRQLNDQSEKLSTLTSDLRSVKLSVESAETRMAAMEQQQAQQTRIVRGLLAAIFMATLIILTLVILRK